MPAGRPTKMTETTVQKLEEAFLMGCTDIEACLFADISRQTLYSYISDNPEFSDRKELLKQNPFMRARKVQMNDLLEGNSTIAQKVLDRKEGSKVAVTGADGGPIQQEVTRIERVIVKAP
jgi:hypothetical protein